MMDHTNGAGAEPLPRPAAPAVRARRGPATPPSAARRRAAVTSPGYRHHLETLGVDPLRTPFEELPFLDKATVFADDGLAWAATDLDPVELMTSSGQTGTFSLGITSRSERREIEATADDVIRSLGGGAGTRSLLVNCMPMGVAVPTSLAVVATPATHLEMAVELLARRSHGFDRTIVIAEPVFLKELFESALDACGPGWAPPRLAVFTGGEWVAESLRTYLCEVARLGPESPGIFVSMGAAEIGLHALYETPELRAARALLQRADDRSGLFGANPGYTPSLFTYDPSRFHFEERRHVDGSRTLACTTLRRRALPLVRYDLGDLGNFVSPSALNLELATLGSPVRLEGPVVAVWGRRQPGVLARPEAVKEALFAHAAHAASITGRFFLDAGPVLHLQLRRDARATPALAAHAEAVLRATAGGHGRAVIHPHGAYPYHEAGDYQHKPRYGPQSATPSLRTLHAVVA